MTEGMTEAEALLAAAAGRVEARLHRLLPTAGAGPESQLFEAMRYACLNGGKRLRPALALESSNVFGVELEQALAVATAIEMLHCYSLIHDDLPAMDNDDLRRNLPTCHIAYGEATAILAGDALQTQTFNLLADAATHESAEVRIALLRGLAAAAGARGMVAGQAIDLALEGRPATAAEVERLQALKTGALIAFSAEAGAILGQAGAEARRAMAAFGRDLGLAFQIVDDLLDVEGSPGATGKAVGKDAAAGKATLVAVLGCKGARARADRLAAQAIASLAPFGESASRLRALACFVVERRR